MHKTDYGAHEVELSEKERFLEAAFSNDGDRARALLRPALVAAFEEEDRLALNRSAEHGNVGAVRILRSRGRAPARPCRHGQSGGSRNLQRCIRWKRRITSARSGRCKGALRKSYNVHTMTSLPKNS